jgi:Domain of unknown function (DUF222)
VFDICCSDTAPSDRETIMAAYDELDGAFDKVLAVSAFNQLTHPELLAMLRRLETQAYKQCAVAHKLINRLAAEADPQALGGTSLADVLATRLRISKHEARRRIHDAELLGPRTAMTGEPLAPKLPNTAAAQERGEIGPEHLRIIRKFFKELPASVDYQTREAAEADLARIASGLGPAQLPGRRPVDGAGQPDGSFSDAERARRRALTIGCQQADGMTPVNGLLDPEARATLDAVFAKCAAPGMCNPDDEATCVDSTCVPAPQPVAEESPNTFKTVGQPRCAQGR